MKTTRDLTGQKFFNLTILGIDVLLSQKLYHSKKSGKTYTKIHYRCKCDCGNLISVCRNSLIRTEYNTKSCGCYNKKRTITMGRNRKRPLTEVPITQILCRYICSAKKRNHLFELSREEFTSLIFQHCFYCGKAPDQLKQNRNFTNDRILYNGIDRIDSSQGYTIGNCVTCCKQCNTSKWNTSQPDFFNMVKRIYEKHLLQTKD